MRISLTFMLLSIYEESRLSYKPRVPDSQETGGLGRQAPAIYSSLCTIELTHLLLYKSNQLLLFTVRFVS